MTVTIRRIDYTGLPEHMRDGARRYIEHGIPPVLFLVSVICNDLHGAYDNADNINRFNINSFVRFFQSEAPDACWGSPEIFVAWIKRGGMEGVAP